jgi:uncharacterized protein (UPF0332 family)
MARDEKKVVRSSPVALTAKQQRDMARLEFAKAKLLLSEADSIHKMGKAHGGSVRAAYYAMEHAACAAILLFGGVGDAKGFPRSHHHIIAHFGTFAAKDRLLDQYGGLLSQVYSLREIADYSATSHPGRTDADFALRAAREFLSACAEKWKATIDPAAF